LFPDVLVLLLPFLHMRRRSVLLLSIRRPALLCTGAWYPTVHPVRAPWLCCHAHTSAFYLGPMCGSRCSFAWFCRSDAIVRP
jgi:hypothetical protein